MAEKKVYVIHENLEWTKHLVKWLEEKKIPYELWDLSKGILNLQEAPPEGVFYNRMSAGLIYSCKRVMPSTEGSKAGLLT